MRQSGLCIQCLMLNINLDCCWVNTARTGTLGSATASVRVSICVPVSALKLDKDNANETPRNKNVTIWNAMPRNQEATWIGCDRFEFLLAVNQRLKLRTVQCRRHHAFYRINNSSLAGPPESSVAVAGACSWTRPLLKSSLNLCMITRAAT